MDFDDPGVSAVHRIVKFQPVGLRETPSSRVVEVFWTEGYE